MDSTQEPRGRRRPPSAGLTELAERVARLETTAEHLQETLTRIDSGLASVRVKLDAMGGTMDRAMGGLRVGAVVWQLAAGALGFLAAHLWPVGK